MNYPTQLQQDYDLLEDCEKEKVQLTINQHNAVLFRCSEKAVIYFLKDFSNRVQQLCEL